MSEDADSQNSPGADELLDRAEVAAYTGLSMSWWVKYNGDPRVPGPVKKVGRRLLYRKREVDEFMKKKTHCPESWRRGPRKHPGEKTSIKTVEVPSMTAPAPLHPEDSEADAKALSQILSRFASRQAKNLDGVENWRSGVYEMPHGVFVKGD